MKQRAPSLSIIFRSSEEKPDRVSPNGPPLPGSAARGAAPHTKPRRPHFPDKERRHDPGSRPLRGPARSCGPGKLCLPPEKNCPSRVTQPLRRSKPRVLPTSRASALLPAALRRPPPLTVDLD